MLNYTLQFFNLMFGKNLTISSEKIANSLHQTWAIKFKWKSNKPLKYSLVAVQF